MYANLIKYDYIIKTIKLNTSIKNTDNISY